MTALWTQARFVVPVLCCGLLLLAAACDAKKADGGGSPGSHSNEEFCKAVVAQSALASKVPADPTKRTAYYTEQKAMNAKLLKLAPPAVQSDTQLAARTSDAVYDAFLAGDAAAIRAKSDGVLAPEYRAAAKRISIYCGLETPGQ